MKHLVLLGAGHAQLDLLTSLARRPLSGWAVTLVTPQPAFHYSGMLPAIIAGLVPPDAAQIPVAAIARRAGADVREASVLAMDTDARTVMLSDGSTLGWDLCSMDVGSAPAGASTPGVAGHAFVMRPFSRALALTSQLDQELAQRPAGAAVPAVVVGGGAAGVEIAFAVAARIRRASCIPVVTIVDAAARDGLPLAGFSHAMRRRTARALTARGISVIAAAVTEAEADRVRLRYGVVERDLASVATAWVTGAAAQPWLATSGLACDARGFPLASPSLALDESRTLFGGGDCITLRDAVDTPKAGVYAVRMAPVLAANILARAEGREPAARYAPQRNFLALLSTSDGSALLRWHGVALESRWAQRLKQRIDEGYLRRYQPHDG